VVHPDTFTVEQDMEASIAKAPPDRRQLAQSGSRGGIIRSDAPIANRGSICSEHTTRPPFAHLERHLEMSDSFAPCDGRHH
jgi:hypothetical protein